MTSQKPTLPSGLPRSERATGGYPKNNKFGAPRLGLRLIPAEAMIIHFGKRYSRPGQARRKSAAIYLPPKAICGVDHQCFLPLSWLKKSEVSAIGLAALAALTTGPDGPDRKMKPNHASNASQTPTTTHPEENTPLERHPRTTLTKTPSYWSTRFCRKCLAR